MAVLVYKCFHGLAPSYTSPANFIIQQSRSFEGVCVPLRLTNCLFPVPDSQPTATELFQSPLYGSGTVFRSISHLLRHFPSFALTWRHTSSNSVTRNYCCHACEVTLSFMDTLIALTYLHFKKIPPFHTTSFIISSSLSPVVTVVFLSELRMLSAMSVNTGVLQQLMHWTPAECWCCWLPLHYHTGCTLQQSG